MDALVVILLTKRIAILVHERAIPRRSHVDASRERRDEFLTTQTVRSIGEAKRRDRQSRNSTTVPHALSVMAPSQVSFLLYGELGH